MTDASASFQNSATSLSLSSPPKATRRSIVSAASTSSSGNSNSNKLTAVNSNTGYSGFQKGNSSNQLSASSRSQTSNRRHASFLTNSNGPSRSGIPSSNNSNNRGGGTGNNPNTVNNLPYWKRILICGRCCSSICHPDNPSVMRRRHIFRNILQQNRYYKYMVMVCTVILLFGAQVRDIILFPEYFDDIFDLLFMICFVLFLFDLIMRIDIEPNYFDFFGLLDTKNNRNNSDDNIKGRNKNKHNRNNSRSKNNTTDATSRDNSNLKRNMTSGGHSSNANNKNNMDNNNDSSTWYDRWNWGSFYFWCDLASTLSLLYELSFVNKDYFAEVAYTISVDQYGIPKDLNVNSGRPVEVDDARLYISILKTARLARYIRSSTSLAVRMNATIMNIISPLTYYKIMKRCYHDGVVSSVKALFNINKRNNAPSSSSSRRRFVGDDDSHEDLHVPASSGSLNSGIKSLQSQIGFVDGPTDQERRGSNEGLDDDEKDSTVRNESQVGSAMRDLTSQRVALSIIIVLFMTVLFTYTENDETNHATMVVLHNQTANPFYIEKSLDAAISSSVPDMYAYILRNQNVIYFDGLSPEQPQPPHLRPRELLNITIKESNRTDNAISPLSSSVQQNVTSLYNVNNTRSLQNAITMLNSTNNYSYNYTSTTGRFKFRGQRKWEAWVSLLYTFFIIFIWMFGVAAFAGPVSVLVVIPIERMVRLLGMLMIDPLGYTSTRKYKRFVKEEDEITKKTRWPKEVLKGMETSFLMSTILRIGSLMKVGFGSAGVEIIRQNLEKGHSKNMTLLNSKGSIVSCIFLFSDIRNFTDATESLQEEVFVFTNSIAAVVHSYCAAYGGSANKNVGDAFLLSWLLDEDEDNEDEDEAFAAKNNQADKCLYAVVKICIALRHDQYYLEALSEVAREALTTKLRNRPGHIVQMGFGLHAGKAVQGAIGSQRKIDATYVSESVETSEFLESSTKKYGVNMLMSGSFHRLLDQRNKRRCRKVDQILVFDDADGDDEDVEGQVMELLTFDMNIDALNVDHSKADNTESDMNSESDFRSKTTLMARAKGRRSVAMLLPTHRERMTEHSSADFGDQTGTSGGGGGGTTSNESLSAVGLDDGGGDSQHKRASKLLTLPTGPAIYNANVWFTDEMRIIRQRYSDGIFFQKFNAGLQSFYGKDWDHAKQCFTTIINRFEDGPSRYFLNQIEQNDGKPPKDFLGYGTA